MREEIDLPTVFALRNEWRQRPPTHHLLAGFLKYEPPDDQVLRADEVDASEWIGSLGTVPVCKVAPIDTRAFDAYMMERKNNG